MKARELELHFNDKGNLAAVTAKDGETIEPIIGKTVLFKEVLPHEKTYEDGIRDAIEALESEEGRKRMRCDSPSVVITWLTTHFNLGPADQKGKE